MTRVRNLTTFGSFLTQPIWTNFRSGSWLYPPLPSLETIPHQQISVEALPLPLNLWLVLRRLRQEGVRKVNNSREAQNVEWAGKLSEGNINDLMFNLKNCGFKTFLELNLLPPFATLWVMKHGLKVPTECSASAAMMDQLSDGLIFWIFTSTWHYNQSKSLTL